MAINFKYRVINSQGQPTGFRAKKATLGEQGLQLKDRTIPAPAFLSAATRDKRIVFGHSADGEPTGIVMEVYGAKPEQLAHEFNRLSSESGIQKRQKELESQGRAHELEITKCPCCSASIELTGFPESPEVFCPYCNNIGSTSIPVEDQKKVRVCDKCGYYAIPRGITCFYFYFLLVVYGFRYQRKHMCGPCMRSEGWKMLAGNAIFLLGVPVAIAQLIRAYAGTAIVAGSYKGLERGNLLAKSGKLDQAVASYDEVTQRLGGSAVASYNKGVAYALVNRQSDAQKAFEDSLISCANFLPAAQALAASLQAQGQKIDDHPLIAPFKPKQAA